MPVELPPCRFPRHLRSRLHRRRRCRHCAGAARAGRCAGTTAVPGGAIRSRSAGARGGAASAGTGRCTAAASISSGTVRSRTGPGARRARAPDRAENHEQAGRSENRTPMTVGSSAFLPQPIHAGHRRVFASCGRISGAIQSGGEAPLHFFAHARSEEDARGAVEGLLESPVALRVAAEAGVDRGRQKAAAAAFDQLNEADQAQAGSVSDQRQADVPVKVAAHLARVAVDQSAPARRASSRAFRATSSAPAPSAGDGRRSERATGVPRARGRPRDARPPLYHRQPSERRTPSAGPSACRRSSRSCVAPPEAPAGRPASTCSEKAGVTPMTYRSRSGDASRRT